MQRIIKKLGFCCWCLGLFSTLTAQSGVLDDIKDQNIEPEATFEAINIADFLLPGVTCSEITLESVREKGTDTKPANCVKTQAYHSTMNARLKINFGAETFDHPDDYLVLYNEKDEVVECGGKELMFKDVLLDEDVYTLSINGGSKQQTVRMDFYSGEDQKIYAIDSVFQYIQNDRKGIIGEPIVIDVAPLSLTQEAAAIVQPIVKDPTFRGEVCYVITVSDCDNGQTGMDTVCLSVGFLPELCQPRFDVTAEIFTSQTFQAETVIEADNILQATADVTFIAGESIILKEGFHAKAGAKFIARIAPCDGESLQSNEHSVAQEILPTLKESETLHLANGKGEVKLKIYPNPTTGIMNLDYYLPEDQQISVWLTDMKGKQRNIPMGSSASKGYHQKRVDLGDVASGIYIVTLQSAKKIIYKKIFVMD